MSDRLHFDSPAARPDPGSVSRLLPELKAREPDAVAALWRRFYQPLVRVAAGRLDEARCRTAGAEDVAVEALLDFCDRVARPDAEERFPRLASREELWKLLVRFTVWAASDHNAKEARRAAKVGGESVLGLLGLDAHPGQAPAPGLALAVTELLDQLPDETLRRVALMKMEGHTSEEIAAALGRAVTIVEVKLRLIRSVWRQHAPEGAAW